MRLRPHFIALSLTFWPVLAAAAEPGWVRLKFQIRRVRIDIPDFHISEEAGKPETGYGARFTTPDRRADLTVQSIINTRDHRRGVFSQ